MEDGEWGMENMEWEIGECENRENRVHGLCLLVGYFEDYLVSFGLAFYEFLTVLPHHMPHSTSIILTQQ